jgi:hypothetical protein
MQSKFIVPASAFVAGAFDRWIGMCASFLSLALALAALSLSELGRNCTHIAAFVTTAPSASMTLLREGESVSASRGKVRPSS